MTEKREGPSSVYQRLVKAAQGYAKALDRQTQESALGEVTEFSEVEDRLDALEKLLGLNLVDLAQQVVTAAEAERSALATRKQKLLEDRGDVERRRQQLADAAEGYDWAIDHKDKRDFIGPLTLEHQATLSVLKLGDCKLKSLPCPSGEELFAAVRAERERLDKLAREVWPTLKDRLMPLQKTPDAATPWAQVVTSLSTPEVPFKKQEPAVLYALVLLRAHQMETAWSLATRPPTLGQQNTKESVSLPRLDKPGSPDKVAAIRIEPPAGGLVGT